MGWASFIDRVFPPDSADWHTKGKRRREWDMMGRRWCLTYRSAQSAMGRFGGGWDWKAGITVGGSTVILNLLVASFRVSKIPLEYLIELEPGLYRAGSAEAPTLTESREDARIYRYGADTLAEYERIRYPGARVIEQVRPIRTHGGV